MGSLGVVCNCPELFLVGVGRGNLWSGWLAQAGLSVVGSSQTSYFYSLHVNSMP